MSEVLIGTLASAAVSLVGTTTSVAQGKKAGNEEAKRQRTAQALEAAKKRQQLDEEAKLEEDRKKKARYGAGAAPMTEYLGANQSGVKKTLLGG